MYIKDRAALGNRNRTTFTRLMLVAIGALWMLAAGFIGRADAHAELVGTSPVAGSQSDASPQEVRLVFNERLDSGGAKLQVLDESSSNVAKGKLSYIEEGKGLTVALPKLGEGHYTVSYSVISADGHPISGAYVFTVGDPAPLTDARELDPHSQVGHGHNHPGASEGLTIESFLHYASRVLYYAGLLSLSGLLLWSLHRQASPLVRRVREHAIGLAGKFALVATLTYVFFSLKDLAEDEPLSEWGRILTETTIGRLYIAELLMALAALLLTRFAPIARLFWIAIALFIESWSGHAVVYEPIGYSVGLDFVHLLAASLWSGGLVLLLAVWLRERPEAGRFALLFSKWALLAFLALWVTGILSTLRFLPSIAYLQYTKWGSWLIVKAALSLLVAVTAFLIRLRLRKGDLPRGALLKADIGLLCAIVVTIGVLTYQTPLPANKPLSYHQMGTDMHFTLRISPNAPGDNEFKLKIWLPLSIGEGKAKRVQLRLLPHDKSEVGYIDVPLEPYTDEELDAFPDFVKSTYTAKGPFMPFAGEWTAQVRVTDAADTEYVKETTFRNY
ncbi:copper resistance CopC/CopD family protein [Cohnella panacarvi]|uniref:copper resistance CopC/CopD family protein n=1 Tax=Cohnella panacarvi TaxID=400776 RepID=UPI00047A76A7|nr:copper resistance protein CopC [Cohnella panacarvi]